MFVHYYLLAYWHPFLLFVRQFVKFNLKVTIEVIILLRFLNIHKFFTLEFLSGISMFAKILLVLTILSISLDQ